MVAISSITMSRPDNYISYDDTDSQTDYFHGYTLCLAAVIKWINEDNKKGRIADVIQVDFTNTTIWLDGGTEADLKRDKDVINKHALEMLKLYEKRVKRICRQCGYTYKIKTEECKQSDGRKWLKTWARLEKRREVI